MGIPFGFAQGKLSTAFPFASRTETSLRMTKL